VPQPTTLPSAPRNDSNGSKFYSQGDALAKADEEVTGALERSKQEDKEKSTVFWVVTICSLIEVYRRFGGMYYFHLQGRIVSLLLSY
jgi:hypothetical protein